MTVDTQQSNHIFSFLIQGSEGFEAQVNHCLENAEYLYYKLKRRTDFQLVFKTKVRAMFLFTFQNFKDGNYWVISKVEFLPSRYTFSTSVYDFIFSVFLFQPEHSNVCFWYLPKQVQSLPPGPERDRELHLVGQKNEAFFIS